jgi:hypothetical protein
LAQKNLGNAVPYTQSTAGTKNISEEKKRKKKNRKKPLKNHVFGVTLV